MKKIVFFFIFAAVIIGSFLFFYEKPQGEMVENGIQKSVTVPPLRSVENYSYFFAKIDDPSSLRLIENSDNTSFVKLVEQNKCAYAINGGYYTTENIPLGLFITGGVTKYERHTSDLLNGFFSIKKTPLISSDEPFGTTIAIQSGPLLIQNGETRTINLTPDISARRSVIALTNKNEVLFILLQGSTNSFEGPTLRELPRLLQKISQRENIVIESALNLDGGSAAAFYSSGSIRSEATRVGSILCATL